jgi:aldose sugar dehydrogenase
MVHRIANSTALRKLAAAALVIVGLALGLMLLRIGHPALFLRHYRHGLTLVKVTSGLATAWSLAFLPDGRLLVTEREGRLNLVAANGGARTPVTGLPPIWSGGEGGLFSVVVDPNFTANRLIYWNYAEPAADGGGASVVVARGRLNGAAVEAVQVIFRDPEKLTNATSFGSRMVFGKDGRLFVTLGDRGHHADAQQLASLHGKIVRINPDGSVPGDNPFVHLPGANPAIWALGFRDPQGIAVEPTTGKVWATDHGPAGGDEVNLIEPAHNYGWPVITYGVDEATGGKIGEGTAKAGMDQPVVWWGRTAEAAVPPTSLVFVTGERYPQWRNQLLVGTLWGQAMMRLKLRGASVVEQERIFLDPYQRIRDVRQGPDGWLYVVANTPEGCVIRLE